jgi:hypothetical protein
MFLIPRRHLGYYIIPQMVQVNTAAQRSWLQWSFPAENGSDFGRPGLYHNSCVRLQHLADGLEASRSSSCVVPHVGGTISLIIERQRNWLHIMHWQI